MIFFLFFRETKKKVKGRLLRLPPKEKKRLRQRPMGKQLLAPKLGQLVLEPLPLLLLQRLKRNLLPKRRRMNLSQRMIFLRSMQRRGKAGQHLQEKKRRPLQLLRKEPLPKEERRLREVENQEEAEEMVF